MRQEMPTTSYALLGLLTFGDELTGYELKQRADNTLRFYWVSPAMSQVYTEASRLAELGLVDVRDDESGGRTTRRYRINQRGLDALRAWLADSSPDFPVLKHPIALRLLLGHLQEPAAVREMLQAYVDSLAKQRSELQLVLDSIDGRPGFEFPALVAEWGLDYYDSESRMASELAGRVPDPGDSSEGARTG